MFEPVRDRAARPLRPATSVHTVLIVSTDPLTAALLGAFSELEQLSVAVHDDPAESPAAAIARHQPDLVLVDVDHPDGFQPDLLARLRLSGIAVVAFSPGRLGPDVRALAEPHGLPWIELPLDPARFREVLREALG